MEPTTVYDFSPYNLPQDLLAAIGRVVACAAQTEHIVQMAIAGCAGIDFEYGGAITTHMNMPLRFSALRATAEIKIDDLDALDELDDLIDAIDKAFERRNAVVHHQWARDPETNLTGTMKETARTSYQMYLVPMTVADVERDALLLYTSGLKLFQFLKERGLLPREPEHPRPRFHKFKAERKKRRKVLLKSE
jgi:hypothetical protein